MGFNFASGSPLPALHSPRFAGHSNLPLFQPSPKRSTIPQSPGANQFGLSALEAMLHSPMYGACDLLLGGGADTFRFDTPSSRAAFNDSIFTSTPHKNADVAPQADTQPGSDSKVSEKGQLSLTQALVLNGLGTQQPADAEETKVMFSFQDLATGAV